MNRRASRIDDYPEVKPGQEAGGSSDADPSLTKEQPGAARNEKGISTEGQPKSDREY